MTKEEQNASNIIGYSNGIIELSNLSTEILSNAQSFIESGDQNIEKIKKNPVTQLFYLNPQSMAVDKYQSDQIIQSIKTIPAFTTKSEMETLFKNATSASARVSGLSERISIYFSKGECKKDSEFIRYNSMKDSLILLTKEAYKSWRDASSKASKSGNEAELVFLKKSPIADFLIPMKTDLNAFKEIFSLLDSDAPDLAQIRQKTDALTASTNTNKDLSNKDTKKLSDIYYKSVYEDFYRETAQSVSYIDAMLKKIDSKSSEESINSSYSLASSSYNNAIDKYNRFIQQ